MHIEWSDEKNEILKRTRDVCFEDVVNIINSNLLLDVKPHHNSDRYPNQMLLILFIKNYTYYVPFVKKDDVMFLKNIIPSRKYHKIYANKE
jgi:uncharacterized DUF497 family protein